MSLLGEWHEKMLEQEVFDPFPEFEDTSLNSTQLSSDDNYQTNIFSSDINSYSNFPSTPSTPSPSLTPQRPRVSPITPGAPLVKDVSPELTKEPLIPSGLAKESSPLHTTPPSISSNSTSNYTSSLPPPVHQAKIAAEPLPQDPQSYSLPRPTVKDTYPSSQHQQGVDPRAMLSILEQARIVSSDTQSAPQREPTVAIRQLSQITPQMLEQMSTSKARERMTQQLRRCSKGSSSEQGVIKLPTSPPKSQHSSDSQRSQSQMRISNISHPSWEVDPRYKIAAYNQNTIDACSSPLVSQEYLRIIHSASNSIAMAFRKHGSAPMLANQSRQPTSQSGTTIDRGQKHDSQTQLPSCRSDHITLPSLSDTKLPTIGIWDTSDTSQGSHQPHNEHQPITPSRKKAESQKIPMTEPRQDAMPLCTLGRPIPPAQSPLPSSPRASSSHGFSSSNDTASQLPEPSYPTTCLPIHEPIKMQPPAALESQNVNHPRMSFGLHETQELSLKRRHYQQHVPRHPTPLREAKTIVYPTDSGSAQNELARQLSQHRSLQHIQMQEIMKFREQQAEQGPQPNSHMSVDPRLVHSMLDPRNHQVNGADGRVMVQNVSDVNNIMRTNSPLKRFRDTIEDDRIIFEHAPKKSKTETPTLSPNQPRSSMNYSNQPVRMLSPLKRSSCIVDQDIMMFGQNTKRMKLDVNVWIKNKQQEQTQTNDSGPPVSSLSSSTPIYEEVDGEFALVNNGNNMDS